MNNTTRDYRHIQFCEGHAKVDIPQLVALFNSAAIWAKNRKIEESGLGYLALDKKDKTREELFDETNETFIEVHAEFIACGTCSGRACCDKNLS